MTETTVKEITVVAAIIENDNQILCVQRGENRYDYISGKYEFPGGKLEIGETEEEALKREILEELELDIQIKEKYLIVNHVYPHFKIIMHSFLCSCTSRRVVLHEHQNLQWLKKKDLKVLDWAAADIPIVNKLMI